MSNTVLPRPRRVDTLISLLGKTNLDNKTGYRAARYRMPDNQERATEYFGLALADYLHAERVILLGTSGSMWDLFVERVAGDDDAEELRLALFDAVRTETVTEDLLTQLGPIIAQKIGRAVDCLLIPTSVSFTDQQALLTQLAEHLRHQERIALDLTHGYRHLAMLGLAASRYLVHERNVRLEGLYYGALEMTRDGITPVVSVDGLAHLLEWAETFEAYEANGDFARFAPLLTRDGFSASMTGRLTQAWHHLQVSNIMDAAQTLRPVWHELQKPLSGASELFRPRLLKALHWCQMERLSTMLRPLALQSLRRGDLLRTAIFGLECILAREVEDTGGDPMDYKMRKEIDERLQAELKNDEHPDWKREAYWLLKNVRNACAHGMTPSHGPHARLMRDPDALRRAFESTLDRLTNR